MAVAKKVFGTIPDALEQRLKERAEAEGRSVSSLVSYLLEAGMEGWNPPQSNLKRSEAKK